MTVFPLEEHVARGRFWPKADICFALPNVRSWGQSGHDILRRESLLMIQSGQSGGPLLRPNLRVTGLKARYDLP
jgi:hypothetical protein